jgi:GrpB-like predicted nucleotidyltransferase (UPF0157 family)
MSIERQQRATGGPPNLPEERPRKPIRIDGYDPRWPGLYEGEKWLLERHSDGRLIAIEHVGSTSVPGLAAKPLVDIMGGVISLADADALVEPYEAIGYQYVPEYEDQLPERRYFRKPSDLITRVTLFHLHVVEVDSEFWTRHLLFRDYLRSHPDVADEYAMLKRRLAVEYASDPLGYTDAKTDFIRSIEARAAAREGRR